MITSFQQLFEELKDEGKQRIIIAGGEDPEAIKAVKASFEHGFGKAILVGEKEKIMNSLTNAGCKDQSFIEEIVHAREEKEKPLAVEEVKKGGILLKGKVNTSTLMRAVLHKEIAWTDNFVSNVLSLKIEGETVTLSSIE